MKQKLAQLGQQFDALSRRERVLISVAILAVVGMLSYLPLESLWKTHVAVSQQLKALEQENAISAQQIDLYQQRLALDPNQDYQQRLVLLQQQNQALDAQLDEQPVDDQAGGAAGVVERGGHARTSCGLSSSPFGRRVGVRATKVRVVQAP